MKIRFMLFILWVISSFAPVAVWAQDGSVIKCVTKEATDSLGKIELNSELRLKLKQAAELLAANYQKFFKRQKHYLAPGSSVEFKGKHYPVIATLGDGANAYVYLIQTEEGLKTLKYYFRHERMMKEELEGLEKARKDGVFQVIKVFDQSITDLKILQEYVPGVSVYDIIKKGKTDFNIDEGDINRIQSAFMGLKKAAKMSGYTPFDFNTYLNYETGELILIDAF